MERIPVSGMKKAREPGAGLIPAVRELTLNKNDSY
jgi:hypothetical protein